MSRIKGRHCWNEKQMLVRNSPDCSSFFFLLFFFMAQLWTLPRFSVLGVLCTYSSSLHFFFLSLCFDTYSRYLQRFWSLHGDSRIRGVSASTSLSRNSSSLASLLLPQLDSNVRGSFSECLRAIWWHASLFATLKESLFQAEGSMCLQMDWSVASHFGQQWEGDGKQQ